MACSHRQRDPHCAEGERLDLVCSGLWSHASLDAATVLGIADECLPAHYDYSLAPQEMEGIAEATDLSMAEYHRAGGFTDCVDVVHHHYKQANGRLSSSKTTAPHSSYMHRLAAPGFAARPGTCTIRR
ncbi:MAG: hypothetical protein R2706_11960 [Acidimicrobiales bacterium]